MLNGNLLFELVKVLDGTVVNHIPFPRSARAVETNFKHALGHLKQRKTGFPSEFTATVLAGSQDTVWALLLYLKLEYPASVPLAYQPNYLPYSIREIRDLEATIGDWLVTEQLVSPTTTIAQVLRAARAGVLLCRITVKVTGKALSCADVELITQPIALSNIRRALSALRTCPEMSQRFLWNERELVKGNLSCLLGLLEDLYRLSCARKPKERVPPLDIVRQQSDLVLPPRPVRASPLLALSTDDSLKRSPSKRFCDDSESDIIPTHLKCHANSLHTEHATLISWLRTLKVALPKKLRFDVNCIVEFSTGVLLCEIVGKVLHCEFPGLARAPKTQAAAVANINAALRYLSVCKGFPGEIPALAKKVFEGDPATILSLLFSLMQL